VRSSELKARSEAFEVCSDGKHWDTLENAPTCLLIFSLLDSNARPAPPAVQASVGSPAAPQATSALPPPACSTSLPQSFNPAVRLPLSNPSHAQAAQAGACLSGDQPLHWGFEHISGQAAAAAQHAPGGLGHPILTVSWSCARAWLPN